MSGFLKAFIGYILFWTVVIVASVLFIHNENVMLSVLLVEIIIALLGLVYLQLTFVGIRQQYTTNRMTKHIKGYNLEPITSQDLDSDYKKNEFTLSIIDDVQIYHKLFDNVKAPSLKRPFMVSHVWLEKPAAIETIVDYHQLYALDQYQNNKIKVGILVTFMRDTKENNNFMRTVIYDNSKKLSYYHIPVLITDDKTYLYDDNAYTINKQLAMIIEHLNKTIKQKKLEF